MAVANGGTFHLDSSQETFEGQTPFRREVLPPAAGLVQWAYSLVVQGGEATQPFSVILLDARGQRVASGEAEEGIASLEVELREQPYELRIESARPIAFRAICTQTYGYR